LRCARGGGFFSSRAPASRWTASNCDIHHRLHDRGRNFVTHDTDPRVKLGLRSEGAGKLDEALEHYANALEVYPGLPAIQGAASASWRA
jgi:hypothetical protein